MSIKRYIYRGIQYVISGIPNKNVTAEITYSIPNKSLKGKRIVITGGGRGIGLAIAKKCVAEGARVLIAGRSEEVLKKSSVSIGCEWLFLDIQNVDSFDKFLADAILKLGSIDCIVNNAGISLHEMDYSKVSPETFDAQINTNLRGPFFLTQKFVEMITTKHRSVSILFISSETGDTVDDRPYGWTKAAINSMMKGLAYRLAERDIRVNAIAPGVTASDMTGFREDGNLYNADSKNGRIYLPDEIAEVACWLLSDVSSCISGQVVTCNNGKTINARWK